MKILIISKEVWRNDQNGGNTLTWMFSRFPSDTEFAQVYCSEGIPNNDVCNNYFKLSTSDIVKAIKKHSKEAGVIHSRLGQGIVSDGIEKKPTFVNRITGSKFLRDIVWKTGYYKSELLKKFILDFKPDIIYAPGYGVSYMNYLIQWINSFTNCPIVSLISDDFYSFHQHSINPFFWIYLFFLRKNVRKTIKCYSLLYTMTEMQKEQLEKDFDISVKVIQKGYLFDDEMILDKELSDPIRIIHVGNLYYNRWKTICLLADCINKVNTNKPKYQLDVVTSYGLSNEIRNQFESRNVKIHLNLSEKELKKIYKTSDIALHVEGFDLENQLKMKMSFSTKIIEYFASGCAIMMICDERQSTYQYIYINDLGFCINSPNKIEEMLNRIYSDRSLVDYYRTKVFEYGKKNHSIEVVTDKLLGDFYGLCKK